MTNPVGALYHIFHKFLLSSSLRILSMRHWTKKCKRLQASVQHLILLWSSRRCTLCAQFMTNSAVDHLIWTIEWKSTTSPPAFISSCLRILNVTLNKEVWSTACCNYYRDAMTFEDLHCLSKSLSLSKYKTVRHLHFGRGRIQGSLTSQMHLSGGRLCQIWPFKTPLWCLGQLQRYKIQIYATVELSCNVWSQNTK